MIIGIGTDIVVIDRINAAITRFGDRFLRRIFTDGEISQAQKRKSPDTGPDTGSDTGPNARFYAMRFAAKEAAWKALSPGRDQGVGWRDFEVISNPDGSPGLLFHGRAAGVFETMTNGKGKTSLSLSDDGGFALAFVVLSAS